jgi:D-arginine dehydrogenase
MERVDTLVVGGGVAGASLAFHLAAASPTGGAGMRLLERAPRAGAHASGRNARLVLQSVAEPTVRRLTAASAAAYAERAGELGFLRCGSLLLGSPAAFLPLLDAAVESRELDAAAVRERVPPVAGHGFAAGLHTPGDGVLDPHRLLSFYLEGARRGGVRVDLGVEVTAVAGEGPFRVETTAGPLQAERMVDAAGAWAGELAACAGAAPVPLIAYKRHLFLLDATLPPALPYVWDLALDAYFRADEEGTLACMCDEEPAGDLAETVTPGVEELLRERLRGLAPALARAPLLRAWSCFRTKAPDGLPVIGPDPQRPAFWWLAGLGGFGLGASWEVGRIAARALLEGARTIPLELQPERFAAVL